MSHNRLQKIEIPSLASFTAIGALVLAGCGSESPQKSNLIQNNGNNPSKVANPNSAPVGGNEGVGVQAPDQTPSKAPVSSIATSEQIKGFSDQAVTLQYEKAEDNAAALSVRDEEALRKAGINDNWTEEDFKAAFESGVLGIFLRNPDGSLTRLHPNDPVKAQSELWIGDPGQDTEYGKPYYGSNPS